MQSSAAFATQMQTVSSESQSLKTSCGAEVRVWKCVVFEWASNLLGKNRAKKTVHVTRGSFATTSFGTTKINS